MRDGLAGLCLVVVELFIGLIREWEAQLARHAFSQIYHSSSLWMEKIDTAAACFMFCFLPHGKIVILFMCILQYAQNKSFNETNLDFIILDSYDNKFNLLSFYYKRSNETHLNNCVK